MRYKLILEYDGTAFIGWQAQRACSPHQKGVQTVLEEAIFKLCRESTRLHAAGRTDRGVHAYGQVAHVDIATNLEPLVLQRALNALVRPFPVAVISAQIVSNDFHARFQAQWRHYLYRILVRAAPCPLRRERVWLIQKPLSLASMQEGAAYLVGHHDFTTFRAAACQAKSPVKTVSMIHIEQIEEEFVFKISAPSFLHHQIRSIVGCLKKVGEHTWHPIHIKKILEARDRAQCAPLAPPQGLYLWKIDYEEI